MPAAGAGVVLVVGMVLDTAGRAIFAALLSERVQLPDPTSQENPLGQQCWPSEQHTAFSSLQQP